MATNIKECQHAGKRIWDKESREKGQLQVDLKWLEGNEAKAMEPKLRCVAALWSENTGIVDANQ